MKLVVVTSDPEVITSCKEAFRLGENVQYFRNWRDALDSCENADLMFLDQVATFHEPHRIAGYEEFAAAKMAHPIAKSTRLVLLAPPPDYDLDFVTGWPDFIFARIVKPVNEKVLRRIVTYV
ncbi:MAG: hypothetical protein JST40_14240 [Armatimonadetes bacterium]|nr:hypothetical protein [Armatimonadota bacterium]